MSFFFVQGCATIPGRRYALDSIEFRGNDAMADDELEEHMASRETTRFAGVLQGLFYDYEIFDRYVVERDLERIERLYRARGYYRARARVGRVFQSGRHARVEILIEEGPLLRVGRVDVHGLDGLAPELAERARARVAARLPLGGAFAEEAFEGAATELRNELGNAGYAYARIERAAEVDIPKNVAGVGYWVKPGRPAFVGEVRIEGLGKIPEAPVRRALALEPGERYSQAELDSARQALLDLGVFASVSVEPELPEGALETMPERVPIRVKVEVSKLRSLRLGGGLQLDTLKTDVHVTAGWEHRNFLGGFRMLQLELVPGVVLYPTRLPTLETPRRLLPQGRARIEFRQPGLFEARTNGVLRTQLSLYPLLLTNDPAENAPILGYREFRASAGLERGFWRIHAALSENVQRNSPFTYTGDLDPDLTPVLVSYPELVLNFAYLDQRLSPHSGIAVRNVLQVAGLGGDAKDLKLGPEARGFIPFGRKVTLGLRAAMGFLFPANYGDTVESNALTGTPGPASRRDWVRDSQLMLLRGYFAGGSGSNRGYGPREIGPHGVVPFYGPGLTAEQIEAGCGQADAAASSSCDLPIGGFTLWEASVELRYPILGPFSGVVFSDAADVAPQKVRFRFDRPHLSAGIGFRYDTPIGPVRFDAGYRIPGVQAPASPDEGTPAETFGLPMALSFGIGEAF
jgi:outer membrane protein insertion porin family/translocation and assembly module TamA